MKKQHMPVIVVTILIAVLLIAGGAWLIIQRWIPSKEPANLSEYYQMTQEDDVALVVNYNILEKKGKLIGQEFYIDIDTVNTYINKRLYYDENEKIFMTTGPTETTVISEEGNYKIENDILYVSLRCIEQYSKLSVTQYSDPNRLVFVTSENTYNECTEVKSSGNVRIKGGIKSPILKKVEKGEVLTWMEDVDEWSKVSTSEGYIGYIQKECLGEVYQSLNASSGDDGYTSIKKDYKINVAWHQVTNMQVNDAIGDIIAAQTGINTISPTWFSISDNAGNISSLASLDYVNAAHAAGIEVWALLDNFSVDISTYDVLSHTSSRRNLINQLMEQVRQYQLDGINLDIEMITEDTAPHFLQFVRELSVECRSSSIVLSIDNPVPTYTKYYDRQEQGIVADYIIIMGYDEHTNSSPEVGSVASLPFVSQGIEDTLKEVPAEKVINGIPFYTRLWTSYTNGNFTSEALGMDDADSRVSENGMEKYWDSELGQNYAQGDSQDGYLQIWLEDEQSIEEKMKLIQANNLAGVAEWKLGFQRSTVWEVISKYLQ